LAGKREFSEGVSRILTGQGGPLKRNAKKDNQNGYPTIRILLSTVHAGIKRGGGLEVTDVQGRDVHLLFRKGGFLRDASLGQWVKVDYR